MCSMGFVLHEPLPASLSALILSSIFFLAAMIISSLLLCNVDCRSSRFELQPFLLPAASSLDWLTLLCKLYRVIRSGSAGFAGALAACVRTDGLGELGAGGGWKVIGG